jgi:hypothetical protein
MGNIYAMAQTVYVWLGQDNVLKRELDLIDSLKLKEIPYKKMQKLDYGGNPQNLYLKSVVHSSELGHLDRLMSNAYWSRLWVVQEFQLARQVRLVCGTGIYRIGRLEQLFYVAFTFTFTDSLLRSRCLALSHGRQSQFFLSDVQELDGRLARLLSEYKNSLCLDPRDRIYSMLSLVPAARILVLSTLKILRRYSGAR